MCEPVHSLGGATSAILAKRPSRLWRRSTRHATMQAIDGHVGGYFSSGGISELIDDGAKCCASGSLPKLPACVRNHRCQIQANRRCDHLGVPDLQDGHDREFQQTRIEGWLGRHRRGSFPARSCWNSLKSRPAAISARTTSFASGQDRDLISVTSKRSETDGC